MGTSCCNSWALMVSKNFPELSPFISESATPMIETAYFIKSKRPNAKVVFIGPCISKKLEALHMVVPSCGACLSNMAITPDGQVIPCQSWLSSDVLGDMQTEPWKKIWNKKTCKKIREESAKAKGICPLRIMNEGGMERE